MPDIKPPSKQSFISAALALIEEFEPKKQDFVDPHGNWKDNPESLYERAQNEFLFQIWRLEEDRRLAFFKNISKIFCVSSLWSTAKRLTFALLESCPQDACCQKEEDIDKNLFEAYSQTRPKKFLPFLIALESIGWILQFHALRLLKGMDVAEWDKEGHGLRREAQSNYEDLHVFLGHFTRSEEQVSFESEMRNALFQADNALLDGILDFLTAEERFRHAFAGLREKTEDERKREEAFQLILEIMQPLQGIVSETSPALLRPCLNFLLDPKIELTSGIPYQSSVILSILQDSRSTTALLEALNRFPVHCSKIRENILYTLGNLREKDAVQPLAEILNQPDKMTVTSPSGEKTMVHLIEQKEEAIWALGKIGYPAMDALQALLKITDHPSPKLRTYLAWALGEIGKAQKDGRGGVSTDIVIALLQLLKTRNKRLFEEAVAALRKIGLPEFIHTLYLYNVGAVNLLGLTPAQRGLYELSETIHFLIETKKRAVVAVNGDSGTGKTYFCQSLVNGFGKVNPEEILHLMRDRKKDQRILNRILGLKWLKSHVDPVHYQDDFLSEDEDAPEEYFQKFLNEQKDKKLILLDGCRDEAYFQRIIDLFYFRGKLDVEVNFRATHSTRRLNLEEREVAIESVKTHLAFLQEPTLEDTVFYQEGNTILYDLDNSIASRLLCNEILELFRKKRIDHWGDLILLGDFKKEKHVLRTAHEQHILSHDKFRTEFETWKEGKVQSFQPQERKFSPQLNTDLKQQPNLIMGIEASDIKPERLRFYAQNQIAGIGDGGSVFIITFLDNRIFYTFQEQMTAICLLGRDILLLNGKAEALIMSFEKKELIRLEGTGSPVCALAAFPKDSVITGHRDGSVYIWALNDRSLQKINAHSGPILSLATDHWGRIYTLGRDHFLKQWDLKQGTVSAAAFPDERILQIAPYPGDKILALSEVAAVHLFDFKDGKKSSVFSPFSKPLSGCDSNGDGRFVTIINETGKNNPGRPVSFPVLFSPSRSGFSFQILDGHTQRTHDCLAMGPKLITCGKESSLEHSIRIWGTDHHVRTTLSKLEILAG